MSPSAIDLPHHCYSGQKALALSLLMLCVSQFNFRSWKVVSEASRTVCRQCDADLVPWTAQIIAWSAAGVKMQTFLNASDNLLAVPVVEDDSGPSGGFPEPPSNVFPTDPQLFRRAVAGDLASTYNFSSWVPQVSFSIKPAHIVGYSCL